MSLMAELIDEDDSFWNDESWAFPNLVSDDINKKTRKDTSDEIETQKEEKKKETLPLKKGKGKKRAGGSEHDQHIWTERERRKKMRNMFNDLHALIPNLPPRADKSVVVDEAVIYIKKLQVALCKLEKQKKEKQKAAAKPTSCDPSGLTVTVTGKPPRAPAIKSREAFLADQVVTVANSSPAVMLANPNNEYSIPNAFTTFTSPNLVMNVAGKDAHISIVSGRRKPGLLSAVCFVMEKYKLDVVTAQVFGNACGGTCMIHARANGAADQIAEALLLVEEIFKQAATEIMTWLSV